MERHTGREKACLFDFNVARETVESFSAACGVSCAVLNREGEVLFKTSVGSEGCSACRAIMASHGLPFRCGKLHLYGAAQAERFGGRYIYFCPSGLAYFASPVMVGGQAAGALVGGPALIMDVEDYLAGEPKAWQGLAAEEVSSLCTALESSPAMEPARLSHMSALLFAASVYVGDNSAALLAHREETAQQQDIGVYLQQLKLERRSGITRWPRNGSWSTPSPKETSPPPGGCSMSCWDISSFPPAATSGSYGPGRWS